MAKGGTIDWARAMDSLRIAPEQYPLLLELRCVPDVAKPVDARARVFEHLESLNERPHES